MKRFDDIKNPPKAPLVVTNVLAAQELLQEVQVRYRAYFRGAIVGLFLTELRVLGFPLI